MQRIPFYLLAVMLPIAAPAQQPASTPTPSSLPMPSSTPGPYKVIKTVKVGGEGGFDYVYADSAARRLYVPRMGPAGQIAVFDLDTLAPVATIPGSGHGAAIDPASQHGFATSKPVVMWDAKTLTTMKTIDVQGGPDGILSDPFNDRIYILSHSAPNVTVIDAKDGSILGTIDLGGAPEQAVTDGKGHIYIDIEDKASIAIVDAATMKVTGHYSLAGSGDGCAGLAFDVAHGILFAACREPNVMVILKAGDGTILDTLPIGKGCDGAVFNPATMEAFSSQGDGTLTIIKENSLASFVVEQTVATAPRAKTLTLDSKTGNILLITAEFGPPPPQTTPPSPGRWPNRGPMLANSFAILVVGK